MFKWNVIMRDMNGCRSYLTVVARNGDQAVRIAAKATGAEITELVSVRIA